jgi:DNA-binding NtrC family response regulator
MGDKAKIVLIEDEEGNRRSLTRALDRVGYEVHAFATAEPALDFLRENNDVALVITDLMLPGIDGFGVLRTAREISPEIGVLMVTGHGSVESAVEAMKTGADDYLTKPVELFELRKRTSAILEKRKLVQRVNELEVRLSEKFGQLIGHTKQMEDLFRQMELVAAARANVLITGDSGTGKELVANALHDHSPRAAGRFMPINCAAIPAEILESELFGHERGAFTGAAMRKVGKFELADGGTLFLDEISELPLEMQVKLLRVLEQREFMRVGGTETIKVDIRLIAATNQDLEALVDEGRFRNDLYYRLKVVTIQIPPLRERREDIPLLSTRCGC